MRAGGEVKCVSSSVIDSLVIAVIERAKPIRRGWAVAYIGRIAWGWKHAQIQKHTADTMQIRCSPSTKRTDESHTRCRQHASKCVPAIVLCEGHEGMQHMANMPAAALPSSSV